MKISVLASGSKGNSTYIGTKENNILIDLGPTSSYVEKKLKEIDVEPSSIKAILLTHTHSDHVNGLKVFIKKYNPTLYLTEKMYEDLETKINIQNFIIIDGDFEITDMNIKVFKTSHDASDSNGYVVENNNNSIVYVTDTGFINEKYFKMLKNRNIYIMESNHDVEKLLTGKYPYQLRRRVLSDRGHLSNIDASNYLVNFIGNNTKAVVLIHLSDENNTEELALQTLQGVLEEHQEKIDKIIIATQTERTELIEVD